MIITSYFGDFECSFLTNYSNVTLFGFVFLQSYLSLGVRLGVHFPN